MYLKVNGLTWIDVVDTIKSNNIKLADIVIHTKYPINTERIFCFSELSTQNINVGLILHNYLCKEMILTYEKPDFFTDSEWLYLLPNLIDNNLLNKPINVFYKNIEHPHIVYIQKYGSILISVCMLYIRLLMMLFLKKLRIFLLMMVVVSMLYMLKNIKITKIIFNKSK